MKNNHKDLHKWRKMYQNLFWVKFWATEILFIGVLLLIWDHIYSMIINAVGLPDNKITTIISFLLIASILTTINEYLQSRKGSELEMLDNIAAIRECTEQNKKLYEEILATLQGRAINKSDNIPEIKPTPVQQEKVIDEETVSSDDDSEEDDADVPEWYKSLSAAVTPLANATYKAETDDVRNFDPIAFLANENANTDILESFSAKKIIRKYFSECVNCITEYVDYSRPRSERREEAVKVEGHMVRIAIELCTENGEFYSVKITFTIDD